MPFSISYANTPVHKFHPDTIQVEVKKHVSLNIAGIEPLRLEALYIVM
jgi:predicted DNA-binding protein (UPF0251 family)